jgi:hypothetical protein
MRKQMQQMQTAAKPSIAVHNNTGGSAVISTSMLAATYCGPNPAQSSIISPE